MILIRSIIKKKKEKAFLGNITKLKHQIIDISSFKALGCLLYEMAALNYPFLASNIVTLYYKIVKGEYKVIIFSFSFVFQIMCDYII